MPEPWKDEAAAEELKLDCDVDDAEETAEPDWDAEETAEPD